MLLNLGFLSWDAYYDYLYAEAQLPAIARMQIVRGEIVHLDEVLTMSARMAAASGNLDWETRYLQYEPQLDRAIKEALRLDPNASHGAAAARTDAANDTLVAMEHRAFELVRQGHNAEAQRLLSSGEYEAQKKIYAAGMTEFNLHLLKDSDSVRAELQADMRQNVITTITSALLLTLATLYVFWATRRWHAVITESNQQLSQKTMELQGLNDQLDDKVRERTKELNESALASLNMMEDAVQARDGLESANEQLRSEITQRKITEAALRISEERFKTMFAQAPLGIALVDSLTGRINEVNKRFAEIAGRSMEGLENIDWLQITHADDVQADRENMALLNAGKIDRFETEKRYLRPDGTAVWIDMTVSPLNVNDKAHPRHLTMIQDITERKAAQSRIAYLSRVHATLSGINALIVRVNDRGEMFREACRVAVETGGFRMSLIAIVDRSAMQIVPVASAGKDKAILTGIKDLLSSSEDAPKTMVAQAIREKEAIVSNDTLSDPRVLLGKQYAESGVRSMVVLPLIVADEAVGAIAFYAREIEFFHEEEMQLLTELAGDIAFAIDHIDKQERLNYLAYYDVLTGLANRTLFLDRVTQYMRSAVSGGHKLAIGLIDLERFKSINDSLGRPAGDALLRQVGEWLTHSTGDANLLARVGEDHFAMVLPEVMQEGDVARPLEKMMEDFLGHPFSLNDAVLRVAAKVGVALFPDDGVDADALFRNAEAALKKAKATGERYLFYTQNMNATVADKLTLENQLRQAVDKGEFALYYQPKVKLVSGKLTGVEALIRWNDPRTGLVPPDRFIPILEETGLIHGVGRWALRQAIEDYRRWRVTGLTAVRIAVNVSPLQLRSRSFIADIKQAIGADEQAAGGLELEITENLIMEDVEHSIASLQAIRAMGITIAIDDFGTGFSSLSYLAKLPVDSLKIDRSFVIDMTDSPEGLALVSTIINLAHSLKVRVVAEGVETEEQSRLLRLLDCDEMQGYLVSKPVPCDIFETNFLAPPPAAVRTDL